MTHFTKRFTKNSFVKILIKKTNVLINVKMLHHVMAKAIIRLDLHLKNHNLFTAKCPNGLHQI